jgi:hypothetical protein
MYCRIRINGHLDPFWQDWLDDLEITHEAEGSTVLSGQLSDQAALYGVLLTIRRLGLTLLSCEADEAFPREEPSEPL